MTDGSFLIGAAIGSGSTAMAAQRGRADFLIALNAGRLRSMGVPSIACMLPVFDATTLTEKFAGEEVLPQTKLPVLLGVNVWEERLDFRELLLNDEEVVAALGVEGINEKFDMGYHTKHVDTIFARVFGE